MTARIDSHQHFWLYHEEDYGWMAGDRSPLQVDYMPPDMQPLLEASGIDGTVAVQARQVLRETNFLLDLADQYDLIRGVVGWVDMRADDVEAQLERFAPIRVWSASAISCTMKPTIASCSAATSCVGWRR